MANAILLRPTQPRNCPKFTNRCYNCHAGWCELHDYLVVDASYSQQKVQSASQLQKQREALNRILSLPAELQVEILARMSPLTITSLVTTMRPIRTLWEANHRTLLRIIGRQHYPDISWFPGTHQQNVQSYAGYVFQPALTIPDYFLFLERLRSTTVRMADYIKSHLPIDPNALWCVENGLIYAWMFLLPTNTGRHHEQEAMDHVGRLDRTKRSMLLMMFTAIGRALTKLYPVIWPAGIKPSIKEEIEQSGLLAPCEAKLGMAFLEEAMAYTGKETFGRHPGVANMDRAFAGFGPWQLGNILRPRQHHVCLDARTYCIDWNGGRGAGQLRVIAHRTLMATDTLRALVIARTLPTGAALNWPNYLSTNWLVFQTKARKSPWHWAEWNDSSLGIKKMFERDASRSGH